MYCFRVLYQHPNKKVSDRESIALSTPSSYKAQTDELNY